MKLLLALLSCFFLFSDVEAQEKDVIDILSGYVKSSNSRDLSEYFSSVIELSILTEEDEYSKAQAELILRNFFSKNKPVSVKIIHRLSSSPNYRFAVLSLLTNTDKFRISISLSSSGDQFLIKEIRIEYDKE